VTTYCSSCSSVSCWDTFLIRGAGPLEVVDVAMVADDVEEDMLSGILAVVVEEKVWIRLAGIEVDSCGKERLCGGVVRREGQSLGE